MKNCDAKGYEILCRVLSVWTHEKKIIYLFPVITKIPVIRATPVLPRARAINIPRKGYRGRILRFHEFHWTRWDIFAIMHLENFPRKYGINPRKIKLSNGHLDLWSV